MHMPVRPAAANQISWRRSLMCRRCGQITNRARNPMPRRMKRTSTGSKYCSSTLDDTNAIPHIRAEKSAAKCPSIFTSFSMLDAEISILYIFV